MTNYYNKDGAAIDLATYRNLSNDFDYRRIGYDILPDGRVVSTVWLGDDHNFSNSGDPLIFETMVFPSVDDYMDLACRRYSNQEEALQGHKELVAIWSSL